MADPASRVIFHHEGAGAPTDNTARPLHEKYSIAIGVTVYQMANPPSRSFITNGTRGRSLQVVFTGNRNQFAVTDKDIRLVELALAEAKTLGWVTATPSVQMHGDTDNTSCPGTNVEARRIDLEHACGLVTTTTPPTTAWPFGDDMPKPTDVTDALDNDEGLWKLTADGGVQAVRGPFHGSYPGLPISARQGTRYFVAITANRGRAGYTLWANDGASYAFPV